jgi:nicotinamidase-related amidase
MPGTDGYKIDIGVNGATKFFAKSLHSAFFSAGFVELIKDNNINKLILSGFLAGYCVKSTAMDALTQ